MANTTLDKILAVRSAVCNCVPFVKGIKRVSRDHCALFYDTGDRTEGNARVCNLSKATTRELDLLVEACQSDCPSPKELGRTHRGVNGKMDGRNIGTGNPCESAQRTKPLRMHASRFAVKFDPTLSGLLHEVQNAILTLPHGPRALNAILTDMLICQEGSSFKQTKEASRGHDYFGTLLVTFPTQFNGGTLVLNQAGESWSFDKESYLAQSQDPRVSFVAIYNDVEYEILPVCSGHRIMLSYQLFRTEDDGHIPFPLSPSAGLFSGPPVSLKDSFQTLLGDPDFLPEGGLIAFGLQWNYPITPLLTEARTLIQDVIPRLNGADAIVKDLLESCKLPVSLMAIYDGDEELSLLACNSLIRASLAPDLGQVDDSRGWYLFSEHHSVPIFDDYVARLGQVQPAAQDNGVAITWITHLTAKTQFNDSFIAQSCEGGDSTFNEITADICLMGAVGPYKKRSETPCIGEIMEQYQV